MVTETRVSNAMRLLQALWDGRGEAKPFSEPRLHCVMKDALELAIKAGLKFNEDDFSKLHENFHTGSGYYIENYLYCDERYYSLAVSLENISACKSYEKAVGLKPFFMSNVDTPRCHYPGHFDLPKQRSRLSIGCQFQWNGERVTVTSFAKDNSYIVACSYPHYESYKDRPIPLKPKHIYKITHDDLRASTGSPETPPTNESKKS